MDGCGHWSYLWKILFPISTPVFVSVGIFSMISTWNSFLWPLIMTNSTNMRTLPVGLTYFTLEFSTRYHLLMAAATMAILPVALVYFIAQRHFIQGIARTGLG